MATKSNSKSVNVNVSNETMLEGGGGGSSPPTRCGSEGGNSVDLFEDDFGLFVDKTTGQSKPVRRFTWRNRHDVKVQVITYGATITTLQVPDSTGKIADVVMGFNDMKGYLNPLNPYFGATVGRVANRIGSGTFTINGKVYNVSLNLGKFTLHGGFKGFDKVNWDYYINGKEVIMSYDSPDGEEGFPGNLLTQVTYQLTDNNEFLVDFKATTTKPTYANLTNHSYFNLAGANAGAEELYKHVISINADKITDVNENYIPTGKFIPVANTVHDLRIPKILGNVIHKTKTDGYDENFCINRGSDQGNAFVARVSHPPSGRVMEVYSNQPGVQLYTSNSIPENPKNYNGDKKELKTLPGKEGDYYRHGALCLETQNYPDAINHKNFPKAVLNPGETYHHSVIYKFFVEK